LSFVNENITKIAGKTFQKLEKPLIDYHKSNCLIADDEIEAIQAMDRMKTRAKTENVAIPLIYEEEMLSLKSQGMLTEKIARIMPPLADAKASLYKNKWTKYPLLPQELGQLKFENGTKTESFMNTYSDAKERFLLTDCIEEDQRIIIFASDLQKYPVLADFTDYMTETWVDDSSSFEIKLWNHFDSTEERVNNNNEAYNLRIITRLGHVAHPNIWKWVELIQKEEFLQVAVRCAGLLEGSIKPKVRRNHDLERDLTILKAKNKYLTSGKKFDNTVDLLMDCKAAVENFVK
jgi:hypothetical protein